MLSCEWRKKIDGFKAFINMQEKKDEKFVVSKSFINIQDDSLNNLQRLTASKKIYS